MVRNIISELYEILHVVGRWWFQTIHSHHRKTRFRSLTNCLCCGLSGTDAYSLVSFISGSDGTLSKGPRGGVTGRFPRCCSSRPPLPWDREDTDEIADDPSPLSVSTVSTWSHPSINTASGCKYGGKASPVGWAIPLKVNLGIPCGTINYLS